MFFGGAAAPPYHKCVKMHLAPRPDYLPFGQSQKSHDYVPRAQAYFLERVRMVAMERIESPNWTGHKEFSLRCERHWLLAPVFLQRFSGNHSRYWTRGAGRDGRRENYETNPKQKWQKPFKIRLFMRCGGFCDGKTNPNVRNQKVKGRRNRL
jgi:hypothetical protein